MNIKKIIVLSGILIGLAGCSGSGSDAPANESGTVTAAQLVGTWIGGCEIDETDPQVSAKVTVTLTTTGGVLDINIYSDGNCQQVAMISQETFSYVLGPDFTLDGTVAGITTGTEFDNTSTTAGSPDFGVTNYGSIALVGNKLYVGDEEADPAKDSSAADKRPTKLDPVPLTKQ